MNIISPTELTRDIAKSAAVQMAEYNYTEKMKNCGKRYDVTDLVPRKIAEKAARNIPTGAVFVGIDLSPADDMTGNINIKRMLQRILQDDNN